MIGRDEETQRVVTFVHTALTGGGSLLLSGDAGLGKSAVLDLAAEVGASVGAHVLRATGDEFAANDCFAALRCVLSPLHEAIERLPSSYRTALSIALGVRAGDPPSRLVLCNATLDVLRQAGTTRPVLIVVDDGQWLDPASVHVLSAVAHRLAGLPLAFIGATRPDPYAQLTMAGLPELALRPLDQRSAESLLANRFPQLAPTVMRRIVDEAEGNPWALLDFASAMTGRQRSGLDRLPLVLRAGQRVTAVFRPRLDELSAPSRLVLLLAALEGSGDLRVLDRAADIAGGLRHLDAAEELQLVSTDAGGRHITFRHPLLRSALVETATEVERRRAHLALADVFTDRPDRRAWHLSDAAARPDERVAELLEQVSGDCLRRGYAVPAVNALIRSAELTPQRQRRGQRLVAAAYLGATVTGQLATAAQLLEAARNTAPELTESLGAAIAAASLLLNSECDIDPAHRLIAAAILRSGEAYRADDATLVEALYGLFMICWYGGRAELWRPFEEAMARVHPAPPALLTLCATLLADPARQSPGIVQQLDHATHTLWDEADPVTITRTAMVATYTDRVTACREPLWRVVHDCRRNGATTAALSAFVSLCVDDWLTGQWNESLALAEEGAALSRVQGNRRFAEILGGYIRPLVLAARGGDDDELRPVEDLAQWAAAHRLGTLTTFALHVRMIAAVSRGDFDNAYRHASMISPPGVLARYTPHALWVLFDLVESAVRTGRDVEAAAHVDAIRAADVASISPRLALVSSGCAALIATGDDASAWYEQAIAVPGADRSPFELGRVQLAYGEHLRRTRAGVAAQTHLAAAMDIFEGLGATPWLTRAGGEVRALGRTTARGGTPAASALLTQQELEITQLAASGLTNREIGERLYLSPRTIGAHLYKVYPKLGVTSRAALRDALALLE